MEGIACKRSVGLLFIVAAATLGPVFVWRLVVLLWPAKYTIAAGWLTAEWCFFIFWYRRMYHEANKQPPKCQPDKFSRAEAQKNFARFIKLTRSLPGGVDPVPYLTQWFCNAPFEEIRRDNVAEMLTYGFWYRKRSDMTGDLASIPDQMVDELESALNVKFPPGYTPGMKFMAHLWEDLRAHYRPLCMYLGFEVAAAAQRLIMASYGFKIKHLGLLTYYTLNCGFDFSSTTGGSSSGSSTPVLPEDDDNWTPFAIPQLPTAAAAGTNPLGQAVPDADSRDKATPVMFLHGVGGLILYLEMLKHVIGLRHPVLVVEYKHVAMRLSSYIPTVDEVTNNIERILQLEGIPRVCVVGHSYGSLIAARLSATHRHLMHSLCLIDPVCLGMFMPHLLHNFMYRRPRVDWKHPDVLVRDLALWFASRDVHIAATFARRFYWTDLNLWPEDLPPGSCVVLSGNDDLCHAEEVAAMLKLAGTAKVILNPHLFHGAFLLDPSSKAHLMREVAALLASSGSLVVRLARPVVDRTLSAARSLLAEVETLTSKLSHIPSYMGHDTPRHHQQQHNHQQQQQRSLRRTLTDLPSALHMPWQRPGSWGPAAAPMAAAAAAAAAGSSQQQADEAASGGASAAAAAAAGAGVGGAAVSADVDRCGSDSRHRKNLSTIPSMSDGGASGEYSRKTSAGSQEVTVDYDTVHDDVGNTGQVPTGHEEGEEGFVDVGRQQLDQQQQQQQHLPEVGVPDNQQLMDDSSWRQSKAARMLRRAFTTMTGPERKGRQQQQQHAAGPAGSKQLQQGLQQQLQQEAQQLQQEAQQLQQVLQQSRAMKQ